MITMIKIEVVYALPDAKGCYLSTQVPEQATILQALTYLDFFSLFPDVDLAINKIGIFGKQVTPDYMLVEGDRLEIYRPIYVDPKVARHQAVKKAK
jgi:putative ubiquitin-RnfH superfamily antitoxin RatB of RatAB toxin-antitoxin module